MITMFMIANYTYSYPHFAKRGQYKPYDDISFLFTASELDRTLKT